MDCSPQVAVSMGFSRQEYLSGLPFPPPEDLPNPGIKPTFPESPALVGRFFITEPPGKPIDGAPRAKKVTVSLKHAFISKQFLGIWIQKGN